jgi:hypothetical protein
MDLNICVCIRIDTNNLENIMKHKTVLSFDDLRDDFSRYEVRPRSANQHNTGICLKTIKSQLLSPMALQGAEKRF